MFRNLCFSSLCHTSILNYPNKLASSLEYPERIQRGLEWTQLLKRLSVCSLFFVCKFSHFSLFHPSLFIQYSTEECSTVQLLASSLEYPERIRVDSVVETSVCLFFVCLLACQQIFSFFPLSFFSFYTVQYRRVQYSTVIYL